MYILGIFIFNYNCLHISWCAFHQQKMRPFFLRLSSSRKMLWTAPCWWNSLKTTYVPGQKGDSEGAGECRDK